MARRHAPDGGGLQSPGRSIPLARSDDVAEAFPPTVVLVDDDLTLCAVLKHLLSSLGLRVEAFNSARELVSELRPERTNCLVLDIRLPDKNGLELHEDLTKASIALPVIFISGHGDVRMAVRAMKAGAVDFLVKPFGEQELVDAVQTAIRRDQRRREYDKIVTELRRRFQSLTKREQEVMALVVSGRRNKAIAGGLAVSETTVKAHRNQVMKKMGAESLAELIGMGQLLGHAQSQAVALLPSELAPSNGASGP
jgi:FixJ family two-component response regulator